MKSGYDFSHRVPFRLLQGRLGIYNTESNNVNNSSLEGLNHQAMRFQQGGGNKQYERMIKDKRRSLERALNNSYQSASIIKCNATNKKPMRALINPNKLKPDYDDKILSVGYEYNIKCGDIFEWVGTNTYWIVYLQDLTELAYFRGDIRKCSYQIKWENEGQQYMTYAAIRGPIETRINYLQKHEISIDTPNHSLNILLPCNEDTKRYFTRYRKFYLQNSDICWRVEAIDNISTPGILEINAVEYYANETKDDIEHGIVEGLVLPEISMEESKIIGDTFIPIKQNIKYYFKGATAAEWYVDKKYPVKLIINPQDVRQIELFWDSPYSGQFELYYGDYHKTIVVQSLF